MLKKRIKGFRGQFTIFALFMTVITIIAYAKIYPVLQEVIQDSTPSMDAGTASILSLTPLFILLFIIYSALWYVIPHREER